MKINKILVPLDFTETSEVAMLEAISLSKLMKAKIFLIHVVEYNSYYFSIARELETAMPAFEELETIAQDKLNKIVSHIHGETGIKPQVIITSGDVSSEIISFSKKKKIDLIIMGTHGASGYKEMFLGTNAQRVVTFSAIPVLTLKKTSGKTGYKNILLPIDNSRHSREKVNIAMVLATLFNSKIHILGLLYSREIKEMNKFKIKLKSVEKIVKDDKLSFTTEIVEDSSLAKAAIKYAAKNKCDLIVINTGHESNITGVFLGVFHQQIVNHSRIPVLSVSHTEDQYNVDIPGFGI